MVLEKIKGFLKGRPKDPFDPTGLEKFSPRQQERILGSIGAKESEILKRKEEIETARRVEQLERRSGIKKPRDPSAKGTFQKIREFRQGNLERQAKRSREFQKREEDFRAGNLKVKPVGPTPRDPRVSSLPGKVKEIKLKSPPKGLL